MKDEPDPSKLGVNFLKPDYVITQDKSVDPFKLAEELSKQYEDRKVCIVLPGTKFDRLGTRYGRGGGWYDRFLSAAPYSWTRLGITSIENVSKNPLERKPWDQPVDWLAIVSDNDIEYVKTEPERKI